MDGKQENSFPQLVSGYLSGYFELHGKDHLPERLHRKMVDTLERELISQVLELTRCNQVQTAKILGINRNTLRVKMSKLGIEVRKSPV